MVTSSSGSISFSLRGLSLLGALWVLVFMVAWHTRDKVRAGEPDLSGTTPMVLTR